MRAGRLNGLEAVEARAMLQLERWTWTAGAVPFEPHAHEAWQICEYLNAPGEYLHRGARHDVAPGAFVVVPPGDAHGSIDAEVRLGARYCVWYFDDSAVASLSNEMPGGLAPRPRIATVWRDARLSPLMARLANGDAEERVEAAERLVVAIAGTAPDVYARAVARTVAPAAVEAARAYLHAHVDRAVPMAEVAAASGLSVSRLAHAFRERYHVSPAAFGRSLRVDRARRLLLRGADIADAAARTGFVDQAHLTRTFARLAGTTPAAYAALARSYKTRGDGPAMLLV